MSETPVSMFWNALSLSETAFSMSGKPFSLSKGGFSMSEKQRRDTASALALDAYKRGLPTPAHLRAPLTSQPTPAAEARPAQPRQRRAPAATEDPSSPVVPRSESVPKATRAPASGCRTAHPRRTGSGALQEAEPLRGHLRPDERRHFSRPAVCPGPAAAGPHRPVLRRAFGPPQAALRHRASCRRARTRAQAAVPLHPSRPARAPRHHHLAARSAPRCCPFSAAVDDAPRPRLPRRHLRLLPLLRAHARHPGRHHTAGDCRRAPRCSAAAASLSCRTTAAVLSTARSPLSLAPPARRFAPRSSRRAGELDSVRLRSPVAARFPLKSLCSP